MSPPYTIRPDPVRVDSGGSAKSDHDISVAQLVTVRLEVSVRRADTPRSTRLQIRAAVANELGREVSTK